MMRRLNIGRESLPIVWDADFLYGPRTATGEDTYVLWEINVSSVCANSLLSVMAGWQIRNSPTTSRWSRPSWGRT